MASTEITRLLADWAGGDAAALDRLAPLVYGEMRRIAARQMRGEAENHTLQATALVNEVFLRLCGGADGGKVPRWEDRAHFYAACARIMRHILTDHARAHLRAKRGAGAVHVPLDAAAIVAGAQPGVDHAALDEALQALEAVDARKARIVELRFYTGLGIEETAAVMAVSPMTVRREWTRAKAWLYRAMAGEPAPAARDEEGWPDGETLRLGERP